MKIKLTETIWETWFVASIVIFFAYLFVGTLPNSLDQFPNWLPFFIASIVNLSICIYYGVKPRD
jgi:hypothetical protein